MQAGGLYTLRDWGKNHLLLRKGDFQSLNVQDQAKIIALHQAIQKNKHEEFHRLFNDIDDEIQHENQQLEPFAVRLYICHWVKTYGILKAWDSSETTLQLMGIHTFKQFASIVAQWMILRFQV